MRTATIAEAKEQLEELIAAARAGETVEIIDQGMAVARLAGPQPSVREFSPDEWDRRIADLEERGIVRRSKLSPQERDAIVDDILRPLSGAGPSGALQALLDERREGR